MDFNTIQKIDFKTHEAQERAKPFKTKDNYVLSNEPVSTISSYNSDYYTKQNTGLANIVRKNPNEATLAFSFTLT